MFPASDGHITVAAQQDDFFRVLCEAIGAGPLLVDPRFSSFKARSANRHVLIEALDEHTRRFSKAELMARLGGRIPFGPVMNIADIEADPHFVAREMIVEVEQPGSSPIRLAGVPIKMTRTPGGVRVRAPLLGEHTRVQLKRAGLTDAEIQTLIDARAAAALTDHKDQTP
jgi:crotonobetainyl-CoA:carnitine CoA-transferase CaiB-like acyl-CoA transferase